MNAFDVKEAEEKLLTETKRKTDWGTASLFLFSVVFLFFVGLYAPNGPVRYGCFVLCVVLLVLLGGQLIAEKNETVILTEKKLIYRKWTLTGMKEKVMDTENIRQYRILSTARDRHAGVKNSPCIVYGKDGSRLSLPVTEKQTELIAFLEQITTPYFDRPKDDESHEET